MLGTLGPLTLGPLILGAQTTDGPVWVLAGATIALAVVTAVLAGAAIRALIQLDEIKADRHVEVFSEMGVRWSSAEMTEALRMECDYSPAELLGLFKFANAKTPADADARERQLRAQKDRVILLRVPNYFEEAATIAEVGALKRSFIDDYFGGIAKDEWNIWRPTIEWLQEADPQAYIKFERMAARSD